MPVLGVTVAIVDAGRVLLTKREDFEVWCLPGGHVDDGESLATAARREAAEETGLEVELTRLVGVYSRPNWWQGGLHVALFAARPIGGRPCVQPGEVIDARFFAPDALPEPLLWGHRQQIADAVAGWGGSLARADPVAWPLDRFLPRQELYALRDRSGLARAAFYTRLLPAPESESAPPEVPGRLLDES